MVNQKLCCLSLANIDIFFNNKQLESQKGKQQTTYLIIYVLLPTIAA